jgi:hypothetical protein
MQKGSERRILSQSTTNSTRYYSCPKKMNNEDLNPIILSSNYSGTCAHTPLSNEDLLKLTSQMGDPIYGPTLFALKYRVVPCTVRRNLNTGPGSYDDAYTFTMSGQFLPSGRGRHWSTARKQGGMYHATRLVIYDRSQLTDFCSL